MTGRDCSQRESERRLVRNRGAAASVITRVMSHRRISSLLVSVALVCAACSGTSTDRRTSPTITAPATVSPTTTGTPSTTVSPTPLRCPAEPPRSVPPHQIAGTASASVPGRPNALLACRYHGFNQPQPVGALAKSASVPPEPIAAALNLAPRIQNAAVYHCPIDFGETILLLFAYSNGSRLTVSLALGGCRFASNGDRTVATPPAVIASLEATLGHDRTR